MKIVLSRKGMDSQYGGIPSPIIKSEKGYWKFYSLPIPTENSNIRYSDLTLYDDIKVSKFINDVSPRSTRSEYCHLDPDIRESCFKTRPENWKRSFGQVKSAQSHLENHQVGEGDVFMFFGWFKKAELIDGKFRYINEKNYPNGFHAIYSYLQIDQIYKPNLGYTPEWLKNHPHYSHRETTEFTKNNTIYTAAELFKYPDHFNKNGSISFVFSDDLILSKKGQPYRTLWELPVQLNPTNGVKLSYHDNLDRWRLVDEKMTLKSVARGQEFVFNDHGSIAEDWAIDLIKHHSVTD